jgi:hypothetical protein
MLRFHLRVSIAGCFALVMAAAGCMSATATEPREASGAIQPADAQGDAVAQTGTRASAGEDGDMVCQRERPLGSNIPRMICRDRRDMEERRERDQEFLMHMSSRWGRDRR